MTLNVRLHNFSCGGMFHFSCSKNNRDKKQEYIRKTSWIYINTVLRYCDMRAKKVRIVEPEETAVPMP
jgi:hypothetical protein